MATKSNAIIKGYAAKSFKEEKNLNRIVTENTFLNNYCCPFATVSLI